MSDSHKFPIADVLTVVTGICCGTNGTVGLRNVLGFMTGAGGSDDTSITDSGCILVAPRCTKELIKQHAWLAGIKYNHINPSNIGAWLADITKEHGEFVEVARI